ncbi:hypothetical protein N748_04670 [Legionella pneumophila str. 121004]|nr:hypothetical protein N748_04670 [Legionella pneumophila str. 121004]ERH41941.1 hypothetical protein N750_15430 [Legionella pneumophila str. Leg01/53]ERH45176.1 hypothetical protein N751_00740 [Legionella pneumophila str. Leg01/11]ERI48884.1 hypothetical protein N749_07710 [Legionella pneumophila str. Leg01/20]
MPNIDLIENKKHTKQDFGVIMKTKFSLSWLKNFDEFIL